MATSIFKDSIDYKEFMSEHLQQSGFWRTLFEVWSQQDNTYTYGPMNKLRQIRDNTVSSDDNRLLAWKLRRRGITIPDTQNNLTYLQFLCDNISLFYRTQSNSQSFVGFLSFISNVPIQYSPLYMKKISTTSQVSSTLTVSGGVAVTSQDITLNGNLAGSAPYLITGDGLESGTTLTVTSNDNNVVVGTLNSPPTTALTDGEAVTVTGNQSVEKQQLDINTLTDLYGDDSSLAINGGDYYPSPYYTLSYDPVLYPTFDFSLIQSILKSIQPIYLVCKDMTATIKSTTEGNIVCNQAYMEIQQFSNVIL